MAKLPSKELCLTKLGSLLHIYCVHYIVILCFLAPTVDCCNSSLVGESACIRIARYNGQQWSTCVTNLYIRQKSQGHHGCARGQAICIYQCMLEVHGANSGMVATPCACSIEDENLKTENGKTEAAIKPNSRLPSWCFSPNGANCSWFRRCLARRYPCGKSFEGEVIKFAEVLCKLYMNPYSGLSQNGSVWINGVRKCLQVNLVPLLRTWHDAKNCNSLTKQAIASYKHCFYSPFPDYIPTICELPLGDLWRIFWHLRQMLSENTQHSLLAILRMIENCSQFREANLINPGTVRKFVFHVKRSGNPEVSNFKEQKLLTKEFGKKIAEQFWLDREGIVWFAYPKRFREFANSTSTTEFVFYIAGKLEHRMSRKIRFETVNLNNTVVTLIKAVRRNKLCFEGFGKKQDYRVIATTVCRDLECRRNSWKVIAGPESNCSSCSPVVVSVSGILLPYYLFSSLFF